MQGTLMFHVYSADFQNTECISCLAMLLIRQPNWIQTGLATRATPSKMNSIGRCLLNSEGKHLADTFVSVEGMSFDSCQEAYKQYKLFAWENDFRIHHGKPR
ncbi:hypothetical protein ACQJBY_040058 [Aegilops geniculata]